MREDKSSRDHVDWQKWSKGVDRSVFPLYFHPFFYQDKQSRFHFSLLSANHLLHSIDLLSQRCLHFVSCLLLCEPRHTMIFIGERKTLCVVFSIGGPLCTWRWFILSVKNWSTLVKQPREDSKLFILGEIVNEGISVIALPSSFLTDFNWNSVVWTCCSTIWMQLHDPYILCIRQPLPFQAIPT